MPRRKSRENPELFEINPLPEFASTPEQIRRAVQRNAVQRGQFYALNLARLGLDHILDRVEQIARDTDPEIWRDVLSGLGVDLRALEILDALPVRYPYYFCDTTVLQNDPALVLYYRNVTMTSAKVMRGIGLETESHERGNMLSAEKARQLALYFNSTVSKLLVENPTLITPRRHVEMVLTNIGESLGGSWRNEIGRHAYAELLRMLITFFHTKGWLLEIIHDLKGPLGIFGEEEEGSLTAQDIILRDDQDLLRNLQIIEANRVVYKSIRLTNGNELLLNRQMIWLDAQGNDYKIGPDLSAIWKNGILTWSGELKGGADPAGSDEHWKTASRAFDRILEAASRTERTRPKLSFLATMLVDRVAREAALWIQEGKLHSVYNLTQIAEDPAKEQKFLREMAEFLGYPAG